MEPASFLIKNEGMHTMVNASINKIKKATFISTLFIENETQVIKQV
jgi:hypothetical protein